MQLTIRDALERYFADNHFGPDGGYSDAWVDFKLGPVPFPLPNTSARKNAVRFHDVNHVLTGYGTNLIGEFEISAWEIGAGCRTFVAAWVLNLSGLFAGVVSAPKRTWRAFVAGRRSQASYAWKYDELVDADVDAVRKILHVHTRGDATLVDALLFAIATVSGFVVGMSLLIILLSPVTVALWLLGRRRPAAT